MSDRFDDSLTRAVRARTNCSGLLRYVPVRPRLSGGLFRDLGSMLTAQDLGASSWVRALAWQAFQETSRFSTYRNPVSCNGSA
jgi:hypothetical protein